ncbi:MAG: hypothetical protein FJ225_00390 [Lentisphaerae bacterium]|nr:hypothetical protein [Lentisphaerota bacterium]
MKIDSIFGSQFLRWFGLDPFTQVDRITGIRFVTEPGIPGAVVWGAVGLGLAMAALNFLPAVKMQKRVRALTFLFRAGMVGLFLLALLRVHLVLDFRMARDQAWLALVDDSGSMRTKDVKDGARFEAAVRDIEVVRRAAGRHVTVEAATLSGAPLGAAAGEKTPTLINAGILRELAERPRLQRLLLLADGRDVERRDFALTGEALKSRGVALDVVLYGADKPTSDAGIIARPERTVIRLGESLFIRGALRDASGKPACTLALEEDGKKVREVAVGRESFDWFEVVYKPEKAGLHRYTLSMPADDLNPGNNAASFYADVREEKINVLMIEGMPRFEFKLAKVALETDPLVQLVTVCHMPGGGVYVQGGALHANATEGVIKSEPDLFKYDVVILRDVPRALFRAGGDLSETSMKLLVSFMQKRGGGLMVTGGKDVYRAGGYQDSPLAAVLPFDLSDGISKDPQFPGRFNVNVVNDQYDHPLLRLLPDAAENKARWNALPELDGCNNVGAFKPLARPLLTRTAKVRSATGFTNTVEVPVLAYQDFGSGKILAASVDTFWYWQLQPEFDPPPLETLMANIVRYMAPEPGLRAGGVNVVAADPTPALGDTVVLSTLLRDKSYEPLRGADLKVLVTKPDGRSLTLYPCDLPERPGYYEYRFPADQPGDWTATAGLGKEKRVTKFVVRGQDDEYADLSVDRDGMKALAAAAAGTVVDDLAAWARQVDRRPVTEPAVRDLELWNSPAILALFILLVSADCYIRKRQGLA